MGGFQCPFGSPLPLARVTGAGVADSYLWDTGALPSSRDGSHILATSNPRPSPAYGGGRRGRGPERELNKRTQFTPSHPDMLHYHRARQYTPSTDPAHEKTALVHASIRAGNGERAMFEGFELTMIDT